MTMTKEEYEARLQKNNEASERQQWERHPIDVYADVLEIYEDDGVVRLCFRCSRPDIDDPLGGLTVVAARVSMPWGRFIRTVRPFQEKMAVVDAAADAETRR